MAYLTFPEAVVVDPTSGKLAAGAHGQVYLTADSSTPLPIYDENYSPIAELVTSPFGVSPQFNVDAEGIETVFVRYDVKSWEAIPIQSFKNSVRVGEIEQRAISAESSAMTAARDAARAAEIAEASGMSMTQIKTEVRADLLDPDTGYVRADLLPPAAAEDWTAATETITAIFSDV